MVAPLEVPRNTSRAQAKAAPKEGYPKKRGQGHYKGRSPKAPALPADNTFPSGTSPPSKRFLEYKPH
jgi:hypothetical protein